MTQGPNGCPSSPPWCKRRWVPRVARRFMSLRPARPRRAVGGDVAVLLDVDTDPRAQSGRVRNRVTSPV
jgi:hypothetical protein